MHKFWAKVEKMASGCWEWRGAGDNRGYGQVVYLGQKYKAHRFSWALAKRIIPEGMMVLHKCDNRCCVNQDHLFLGTAKDNMQDCINKGRQRPGKAFGSLNGTFTHPEKIKRGSEVNTAKLTESNVRDIRNKYVPKVITRRMLAAEYGVCKKTIDCILAYATWRHVIQ